MKNIKFTLIMFFMGTFLMMSQSASSSTKSTFETPNVTVDSNGNYKEKTDQFTGRFYINKEGKSFPVYISKNGKLYAITGISKKTGKPIRKYLKL